MCDASTEQHRPLTYAPFGPWGRLLCAIPPLIVCCLIPLPLRMVRWEQVGLSGPPTHFYWNVAGMAFWIAVASTRIVHAVTLRDDSLEFHVLLGSWRVSKDKLRGVLPYITPPYWFLWAPHLGFSVAAPPWRLPLFVLRADNPWAPDHDAYQTQYRRLLAYLEASCPKARLGGWERNLGAPPAGLRSAEREDFSVAYSRSRQQLQTLVARGFALAFAMAAWVVGVHSTLPATAAADTRLLQLGWIIPSGLVLALWLWSLVRTPMKVVLGEGLEFQRLVSRTTVKWEQVTNLLDGGFRQNGLTYLPGCGYAKLQYVGEGGRSRSLVIPPVFWLSEEFRKALFSKLEERGRPGLVIE